MPAHLTILPSVRRLLGGAALAALAAGAQAAPATTVLFVGNSFTYGDPAGAPAP